MKKCRCIKIVNDFETRFKVGEDYFYGKWDKKVAAISAQDLMFVKCDPGSRISFSSKEFFEHFSISAIREEKLDKILK